MKQRTGKQHRLVAALALLMAAGLCALAVLLFFRAETMPAPASEYADGAGTVLEDFFACLRENDLEGAAALTAAGSVPVPAPGENRSALLWEAQRACWQFEVSPGFEDAGPDLGKKARVTAPDLSLTREQILTLVQSRLGQALDAAELKSEVYDAQGNYREELVFSCLEEALKEVAADLTPYCRTRELTVKLVYIDGRWRVGADGELIAALTGGAVRAADADGPEQLTAAYEQYVNNLISASLEGLVTMPKVYRLSESTVVAPVPNQAGFGTSKNAADTAAVLEEAAPLLAGRELLWSPETVTLANRPINWYLDETAFAIAWRQGLEGMSFSFCEVVLGHPSQFRRYLADDDFHSAKRYTPTRMAASVNAVAALSGDFYKYRDLGIVVYKRELCRADGETLDTCFINGSGDLLFVRAGELTGEEAIRRYIEENDVVFSLSFGPVMIENGENVVPNKKYPIGQILESYSRCALCQLGECHYLLVTVAKPLDARAGMRKVADVLCSLGVKTAYALDGGQTASLIMNGRLVNPVDFGEERTMSDIIYFATALPPGEG